MKSDGKTENGLRNGLRFGSIVVVNKPKSFLSGTNTKMLIKLFGDDEMKLVGKKIKLEVIKVRNPQTGELVLSLAVADKQ